MYCKSCGQELHNDQAAMCTNCGVKKGNGNNFCATCGAPKKSEEADYCVNCGNRLATGSTRTKGIALLLWFFLWYFGAHQFYVGNIRNGVIYIVLSLCGFITCGVTTLVAFIWSLIDLINILSDKFKDDHGVELTTWWE